jgi:hypothetical protein
MNDLINLFNEAKKEVGLPLSKNWINDEIKKIFNESKQANICIPCTNAYKIIMKVPIVPCGLMKQQAEENKFKLEKELNKKALIIAHKKIYNKYDEKVE